MDKLKRRPVPGAWAVDWISDYGPTEATISVALHRPDDRPPVLDDDYALVPIGLLLRRRRHLHPRQ